MKRLLALLVIALAALAGTAHAQGSNLALGAPIRTVVSALPGSPANTAQTYIVTDGASSTDCATGSGSTLVHCAWTGAAWQALGGGAGGGAPTDAQYLVGAANGTLSAEVVIDTVAALDTHLSSRLVEGPASATDNACARFDATTGKLIQNSTGCTIDDSGNVSANSYSTPDVDGSNRVELFGNPSGDVTAPSGDNLALFTDDTGTLLAKLPSFGAGESILASGAGFTIYAGNFSYAANPTAATAATLTDAYELDPLGCISRSTNQIVIACNGHYRFRAGAAWVYDRSVSTAAALGVFFYRDTATAAYLVGTGSPILAGCEGVAYDAVYEVTDQPVSFSIYPTACAGTLGAVSGETVPNNGGWFTIERIR